jgi:hypothetical protein
MAVNRSELVQPFLVVVILLLAGSGPASACTVRDLVNRVYVALANPNLAATLPALIPLLDEDICFGSNTYPALANPGIETALQFFTTAVQTYDILDLTVEKIIASGSEAVALITATQRSHLTNQTSTFGSAHYFRINGCKIVEFYEYTDTYITRNQYI